jgi:eukaryotic-like serine/threonine-protein kinase
MNPERWRALAPHLDRLLELDEEGRRSELEALRAEDGELAEELREWLAAESRMRAVPFLEEAAGPPTPASTLTGQRFGAWKLVSPIGEGGMGTVWRAHRDDGRFEGVAAVKLLNVALLGPSGEERFQREGTILARLAHPHIARLIDAGVGPSGQPFLVLEYVEGEPIDSFCASRRLAVEARLLLFLDVLDAVAHAHANLVVHRDVKPSNVLVSRASEVKLLDFGIAKLLDGEAEGGARAAVTREGARPLTLAFAAPEQLTSGPITTATDVYSLGALLYLLLGGRLATGSPTSSHAELVEAIVTTEPPRLSEAVAGSAASLVRVFRGDLDTIVAKALKKRPEERYPSVGAFAEDIRRYLSNRPIAARPDAPGYRAAKFVRRHRLPVSLAALAVLATVAGVAGTLSQAARAERAAVLAAEERDFALRELSRSEAVHELNAFILSDAAPGGKPFTAGELLKSAEQILERQLERRNGGTDDDRIELLISIGRQYHGQDQQAKALRLLNQAFDLSRRSPDRAVRARAACALASTLASVNEGERAATLVGGALADVPDSPPFAFLRIFCLLRGAEVARNAGDGELAIARAESADRLRVESGQGSELLGLTIAMDVAESYREAGRYLDASAAFERAWKSLETLGREKTERAGTLLNNWGLVLRALGQPLAAERQLGRAIGIASADGSAEGVSPMLLTNYARVLNDLGRRGEASAVADRALAMARAAGNEQQVTFGLFLRNLVAVESGDVELAARTLAELEPRVAKSPPGHQFHVGFAGQKALLAQARGETALARAAFDRAIELCNESDQSLPLLRRSAFELALGRPDAARGDAERALALAEKFAEPGTPSSRVGRAFLARARALHAGGRLAEAQATAALAIQQLEPAVGRDHPESLEARALASESVSEPSSPGRPLHPPAR